MTPEIITIVTVGVALAGVITTAWCTRRSIAAAVAIWSRKIRSHWLKTRLLVTITERCS